MNNKNNNLETREITSNTPTPPPAATNNNIPRCNASQACAACKYQRRKCAPDCILAPYFPHLRQRQFLNAHKLFGVSNITKIIRNLEKYDKDEAMRTIIYQADVRASDPVGGCYRIIREYVAAAD
ncbi:LOB domain-containing protein 22 [Daucus carota subsp. sativus]|uniref:LOB domain-containing protein 22 n=1 Tax=Daucus carota subsp. sativus TaxID=79200 RepID=UPI0007EFF39F|nr:PREDICTED: LOB domain-containing protein 22-like [Daucus carota subsp. sativus]XP_017227882.1 PREDICTED: LOB domain-containing protein 22-like [Daucus carota subsp. sativus]